MTTWAIIPVKAPTEGKSRLKPVLTDSRRIALVRSMLDHTLHVVTQVLPPSRIIVVSPSLECLDRSSRFGVQPLVEAVPGLNAALTQARDLAVRQGATAVLSVATDLPLLESTDLRAILDLSKAYGRSVLACDRTSRGTNALMLVPPTAIPYRFGTDSRIAHQAAARQEGAMLKIICRPGLTTDLDTPEDLQRVCAVLADGHPISQALSEWA